VRNYDEHCGCFSVELTQCQFMTRVQNRWVLPVQQTLRLEYVSWSLGSAFKQFVLHVDRQGLNAINIRSRSWGPDLVALFRIFDARIYIGISGSHGGDYEDGCLLGCCAVMMEAASTSETSVNFYQTTRRSNPEDNHLYIWIRFVRKIMTFLSFFSNSHVK
jgi:hypothetical protein